MRKTVPAPDPDAWVAALDGWRRERVEGLRAAVASVDGLRETIKWGHIVYLADGPVRLIRAEEQRVLFGFWQGQRLREIEPRLKPGGKYEWRRWTCAKATGSIRRSQPNWPGPRYASTRSTAIPRKP